MKLPGSDPAYSGVQNRIASARRQLRAQRGHGRVRGRALPVVVGTERRQVSQSGVGLGGDRAGRQHGGGAQHGRVDRAVTQAAGDEQDEGNVQVCRGAVAHGLDASAGGSGNAARGPGQTGPGSADHAHGLARLAIMRPVESERERTIAWVKDDPAGAEVAEVILGAGQLHATGVAVGSEPAPYRLDYALETMTGFITTRVQVTARGDGWSRSLLLQRSGAGGGPSRLRPQAGARPRSALPAGTWAL